jgi:hypothetical protein
MMTTNMGMSGSRAKLSGTKVGDRTLTAIGHTRTEVGTGYQTSVLDGRWPLGESEKCRLDMGAREHMGARVGVLETNGKQ